MTRRLVVRPQADAELEQAAAWYSERGARLAAEFVRVIDAAISAIQKGTPPLFTPANSPHSGAIHDFRRYLASLLPKRT